MYGRNIHIVWNRRNWGRGRSLRRSSSFRDRDNWCRSNYRLWLHHNWRRWKYWSSSSLYGSSSSGRYRCRRSSAYEVAAAIGDRGSVWSAEEGEVREMRCGTGYGMGYRVSRAVRECIPYSGVIAVDLKGGDVYA
jgi:hypothetical protein